MHDVVVSAVMKAVSAAISASASLFFSRSEIFIVQFLLLFLARIARILTNFIFFVLIREIRA